MNIWMIGAALAGMAANAAPPEDGGPLEIQARGKGAWKVTCEVQSPKGDIKAKELRGRGKGWMVMVLSDVKVGQCSYEAAPDQPLSLAFKGYKDYPFACPLPSAASDTCEQDFPAGASGRLELRKRD